MAASPPDPERLTYAAKPTEPAKEPMGPIQRTIAPFAFIFQVLLLIWLIGAVISVVILLWLGLR
jgi:hypothetical protein